MSPSYTLPKGRCAERQLYPAPASSRPSQLVSHVNMSLMSQVIVTRASEMLRCTTGAERLGQVCSMRLSSLRTTRLHAVHRAASGNEQSLSRTIKVGQSEGSASRRDGISGEHGLQVHDCKSYDVSNENAAIVRAWSLSLVIFRQLLSRPHCHTYLGHPSISAFGRRIGRRGRLPPQMGPAHGRYVSLASGLSVSDDLRRTSQSEVNTVLT
ncbi:hypothetical protein BD414DRAFT_260794 [Trametes punicea]|nr:hypothetical protein BD414DRAFT_260794 [Trametes punicea]